MDQFMVNVGDDDINVGDEVILLGNGILAEDLAQWTGTNGPEARRLRSWDDAVGRLCQLELFA